MNCGCLKKEIYIAKQKPQLQQQNNQNCSWVEQSNHLEQQSPQTQNSGEIEQNSENKSW